MIQAVELKETDKRMKGHNLFKYVATFRHPGTFTDARAWCWQTWGASMERDFHVSFARKADLQSKINPQWCFHTEEYHTKIYLCSDKEANWFKLRWMGA